MMAKRLIYIIITLVLTGVILVFSCKKDDKDEEQVSATAVEQTKQSESQDAVADKIEQDIDNNIDKLELNNFNYTSTKSAYNACIDISIDSSASLTGWPKTVTLIYNCTDTVNGEKMSQTGTITVVVDLLSQSIAGKLLKKTISFANFKIETDSASLTINGSRTVTRLSIKTSLSTDFKTVRLDVKDSIVSNLRFDVQYSDVSVNFTRMVNKLRTSVLYFRRVILWWYPDITSDTVKITGKITGLNLRGLSYTRETTTPVEITFCPVWPYNAIIAKGVIEFSNDGGKVGNITYSASGCKTTVTLSVNGKTRQIERKLGLGYRRWW